MMSKTMIRRRERRYWEALKVEIDIVRLRTPPRFPHDSLHGRRVE